ncbi:MAG: hypothetical protein ACI8ZO_001739, partial [Flavobacteriales bacterium]
PDPLDPNPTNNDGSSGGTSTVSNCSYELQIIGYITTETTNRATGEVWTQTYPQWGMVLVCPGGPNQMSSSDTSCTDPNNGEVPIVIDLLKLFEEQIDDSRLDLCLKQILGQLKGLKFDLSWILNRFNEDPKTGPLAWISNYNWTVESGVVSGGRNAATSYPYNSSTKSVTSVFQTSKFKDASDLSTARTILHEALHAFFIADEKINSYNSQKTYYQYWSDRSSGIFQTMNDLQHREFFRNWMKDITLSLQSFGKSKGYSYSLQFYNDLAWGGLTHYDPTPNDGVTNLVETPWFLFEYPTKADRDRILNIIAIEQSGKDMNGNVVTKKGKTNGC